MRITRERLLDLALEETERRAHSQDVVSGYVIGSLAAGDPLFGGTGDIDLVLIHSSQPASEREFVPLSREVHLDIAHRPRSFYHKPRRLRRHPWYGAEMCEPAFLYDPTHFFEWAQAAVRGQFHRLDFVHARAQAFLGRARRYTAEARSSTAWLRSYLQAALETVNSMASLTGFPAAGRRVGTQLAAKLSEIGHPELLQQFQQLLGGDVLPLRSLPEWVAAWARAYDHALQLSGSDARPRPSQRAGVPPLAPERRAYFLSGFQSMIEDGRGSLILWPLLVNWDQLALRDGPHAAAWENVLEQLQLSRHFADRRLGQLEQLQDQVDGQLERWSERVGA